MSKDEIIARILESLQSEAIDEIWARQHITDAFEEGFDAGAQSKEEEIAMLRSAHVISVEQAKTKAVQSLFSRVTPCGREVGDTYCGRKSEDGIIQYRCDFCLGRALGREEERKDFEESRKHFTRTVADTFLGELKEEMRREGCLDAAKKIIGMIDVKLAEIKKDCPTDVFADLPSEVQVEIVTLSLLQVDIKKMFGVGE